MKRYIVSLSDEERQRLRGVTRTGKHASATVRRAQMLLHADMGSRNRGWTDARIAEAVGVTQRTVERTRQKFCQQGLEAAIGRKERSDKGIPQKIDGRVEAEVVRIACSTTPNGEQQWSLSMIAGELVKLELVDGIARESVRRTLKKTSSDRI